MAPSNGPETPLLGRGACQIGTPVVFVDMDDVLCAFTSAHQTARRESPEISFPQSVPEFFLNLDPVSGAIDAVNELRACCDLYVLSAPSTRNAHSYTEKRLWIERHFDYEFTKRLILSPNKGLLKGDFLIDDRPAGKGQERFEGKLILFGSPDFPDWPAVVAFLRNKS